MSTFLSAVLQIVTSVYTQRIYDCAYSHNLWLSLIRTLELRSMDHLHSIDVWSMFMTVTLPVYRVEELRSMDYLHSIDVWSMFMTVILPVDRVEDSVIRDIKRHLCPCTSCVQCVFVKRMFRNCMRNAKVLCTPSFMACINMLFGRTNTVF